jgi:hypothetical protein
VTGERPTQAGGRADHGSARAKQKDMDPGSRPG